MSTYTKRHTSHTFRYAGMHAVEGQTEVRQLREEAGMTQEEAAEACDIPYPTFAAYDRGDRQPSAGRMDTIREVLGRRENPSRDGYVTGRAAGSASGRAQKGLYDVPELQAGAGNDVTQKITGGGLQLPRHYIRSEYGIRPEKLCLIRVRGDSMKPTLLEGQKVIAARWEGEPLRDGVVYALEGPLGYTVKRLRFGREDGEAVIWVWSDNDAYADHRHYLTRGAFEEEYTVIAWAIELGQKL